MSNIAKNLLALTLSTKTVFTTADLAILWQIEDKNVLWVTIARTIKKRYLYSIQRGVYGVTDKEVSVFELAGKLKRHSYISFETVLAQAGIIFQWHNEITSASNRFLAIKNNYGNFSYRKLPDSALTNNMGIINKGTYFIASPERALCDKLYKDGLSYFDDLSGININAVLEISKIYNNKRLERNIKKLFSL
jgi:predicted transcriptional regulator of viral defense system